MLSIVATDTRFALHLRLHIVTVPRPMKVHMLTSADDTSTRGVLMFFGGLVVLCNEATDVLG